MTDVDIGQYTLNCDVTVIIGDASNRLSEQLDDVICSMKEAEVSYVKLNLKPDLKSDDFIKTYKLKIFLKAFTLVAPMEELEEDEILERATVQKDKGNEFHYKKNYEFAIKKYQKAVDCLVFCKNKFANEDNHLEQECTVMLSKLYFNLAQDFLNTMQFADAITYCDKGLQLDPSNVKGLYRRGKSHFKLHNYLEAQEDYRAAIKGDPSDTFLRKELTRLEEKMKEERQMYWQMFN